LLSLDTDTDARLCLGSSNNCQTPFKVDVRVLATKLPSYFFSAYQSVQFYSELLITREQYKYIVDDYIRQRDDEVRANYEDLVSQYSFENDIPKYRLLIKLNENATQDRRDFIANGVRSFFRSETCLLFDKQDTLKSVDSSLLLF